MVYLFLIFLATLSLICDSFECHLSSLPCTASLFLLIRLQFHFIIFWFNCAEGIEHWRQVMHFFGMGNICLHRDCYSLIHHSAPNHHNFAWMMVVLLEQLNSTNFLGVVSRCSSVKIHVLDLQSLITFFYSCGIEVHRFHHWNLPKLFSPLT